jgi:hypothetical protein
MTRINTDASNIRKGDLIIKVGTTDHENKRLRATEVRKSPFGAVAVFGTKKGSTKEALLFGRLMPNVKVLVSRQGA